jgi:hypothetical protein
MDKQVLTLEIAMKYMFAKVINYFDKFTRYENILEFLVEQDYQLICNYQLQLRKLSSLTEEEKQFLKDNFMLRGFDTDSDYSFEGLISWCVSAKVKDFIDWCRKNRFDIDNLIESGVAEEVR